MSGCSNAVRLPAEQKLLDHGNDKFPLDVLTNSDGQATGFLLRLFAPIIEKSSIQDAGQQFAQIQISD